MKIILKRPKSKYYDESKYKIYINNEIAAILKENQVQEVTLKTDVITIECKLSSSWVSSNKLTLKVKDDDEIEFVGNSLFAKLGLILPAPIAILLVLARNFETLWLKWLFIGLITLDFILLVYIFIIARRNWISIKHC
jgi:hypothetical protein